MATFLPDPRAFPALSISQGTLCPAFPCSGEEAGNGSAGAGDAGSTQDGAEKAPEAAQTLL